jgi:hypothetical protein
MTVLGLMPDSSWVVARQFLGCCPTVLGLLPVFCHVRAISMTNIQNNYVLSFRVCEVTVTHIFTVCYTDIYILGIHVTVR